MPARGCLALYGSRRGESAFDVPSPSLREDRRHARLGNAGAGPIVVSCLARAGSGRSQPPRTRLRRCQRAIVARTYVRSGAYHLAAS